MLLISTNPCGCNPWYFSQGADRFGHHHPDCPIVRVNNDIERKIKQFLKEFELTLKGGK